MSAKVHWLDAFPDEWTVVPAKRLFTESKIRAEITDEQLTASQDYGVIPQKEFIRRAGRSVVQINQHLDKRKRVEKDDFVISMRSFQGGLERAWASGGIRSSYVVLKPSPAVDVGYFARLFKSQQYIQALQATAHFIRDGQDLSFQNFTLVDLPLPPLDQQTQIAKFLDYETAKIDALIAKQQQLIALLQEKRQAVISHAVTKGLNPAAPLRDSGVAWLGQVPAHWEVSKIGYLAVIGNGSTPNRSIPEYWADNDTEGVGWLNSAKINDGKILAAEQFISQRAVRECHLPLCEPDSVLVAITGEGQTRGRAALLKISATINQHLAYLLPDRRQVDASFLWRQLQARYSWLRFESAGGGSTRAALTCEFLRGVPITLPSLVEQNEIVKWLDTELTRLDSIVDMAQLSMDLLQERRTALIAAAVTGKIDVRGWQPPPANPAGALP